MGRAVFWEGSADWMARSVRAPEEKEPVPRKANVGPKAPTEMNAVDERRLDGVGRDVAENTQGSHHEASRLQWHLPDIPRVPVPRRVMVAC
jgi:hypothetical protein